MYRSDYCDLFNLHNHYANFMRSMQIWQITYWLRSFSQCTQIDTLNQSIRRIHNNITVVSDKIHHLQFHTNKAQENEEMEKKKITFYIIFFSKHNCFTTNEADIDNCRHIQSLCNYLMSQKVSFDVNKI